MAQVAVADRSQARNRLRSALPLDQERSSQRRAATRSTSVSDAANAIVAYIPTEIVTAYVAAVAAINVPNSTAEGGQWVLMWSVLALTPLAVWVTYGLKVRAVGGGLPIAPRLWPWPEIVLASVAFMLWAFSLPRTPFEGQSWYRPGLAAAALLVGTAAVGLVGALVRPGE
jgi:hypothetical protein